ncbi:patatin-like phospholipase family protein [Thermomonospora umbrina]|uniref:NTE family protein n=1 Tax=Thermomonospora umbrina TaxID=111806 RepID=A0A3D9SNW1_9ACTN|nr:patatin-like phospholipase family protein [Thermomonospora umbrina]REE97666.1 NTE family protein [Thermomonospora umbrina]
MTMDGGRALVLGGGGVAGIAWEAGLVAGLAGRGVDLAAADVFVGTSAGSVVGAFLAHGGDLEQAIEIMSARPDGDPAARPPKPDMDLVMTAFALMYDTTLEPREARARIGRMARETPTDGRGAALEEIGRRLPSPKWPDRHLLVTGVDADDGSFVVWDRDGDASLEAAVRASCSVPCVFPTVEIGGRHYMDGGVHSMTNADLVEGASTVVVLEPLAHFTPRDRLERELKTLGDARTVVVGPDQAAIDAFGVDVLSMRLWGPGFRAGLAQAPAVAAQVQEVWAGA